MQCATNGEPVSEKQGLEKLRKHVKHNVAIPLKYFSGNYDRIVELAKSPMEVSVGTIPPTTKIPSATDSLTLSSTTKNAAGTSMIGGGSVPATGTMNTPIHPAAASKSLPSSDTSENTPPSPPNVNPAMHEHSLRKKAEAQIQKLKHKIETLEALLPENRQLKCKVETLEPENRQLKHNIETLEALLQSREAIDLVNAEARLAKANKAQLHDTENTNTKSYSCWSGGYQS